MSASFASPAYPTEQQRTPGQRKERSQEKKRLGHIASKLNADTRRAIAMKIDERSKSIAAFYAGRSILVTGVTGFLGKVLIEKLLRSCPDVREIFLLMRPKNGQSIDDRLRTMLRLPLFDKLREENLSSFEKLIPIIGDTSVDGLGLPPVERRTVIERVSIVFNVAANVRFDENLKKDIFSNTRSARDMCILAGCMKNLVALVHVSTAYAQADKPVVEEITYPPLLNWKDTIHMVETLDEHTIQTFAPKYISPLPNTYTFSKRLAEQVINDYSKDLPCVLFRPSIVISSVEEPIYGWVDNFNGPVGLLIAGGKGIVRTALVEPDVAGDYLPVDVAIKVMISSAWKRGLVTVTRDPSVHVYNGSSHQIRRVRMKDLVAMGLRENARTPLEGIVWYPRVTLTNITLVHYILTLILHVLPALVVDEILKLTGRQPMLLKIQRKVYCSSVQLRYFIQNEWTFHNSKLMRILTTDIPSAERETFGFDYNTFVPENYFGNCVIGAKRYLLNEDMIKIEVALRHMNRMKRIDAIVNASAMLLLVWILWKFAIFPHLFAHCRFFVDGSFLP